MACIIGYSDLFTPVPNKSIALRYICHHNRYRIAPLRFLFEIPDFKQDSSLPDPPPSRRKDDQQNERLELENVGSWPLRAVIRLFFDLVESSVEHGLI